MSFNCQSCAQRKVKCDRVTPSCGVCTRRRVKCIYLPPPPPRRKKQPPKETAQQRAQRYEAILHKHNLLHDDTGTGASPPHGAPPTPSSAESAATPRPSSFRPTQPFLGGNLYKLAAEISNQIPLDFTLGRADAPQATPVNSVTTMFWSGPTSLESLHPSQADAMALWKIYKTNVDPVCKILHAPTTAALVAAVSQQPSTASPSDESIVFAVYNAAVYTTTDADCQRLFRRSRAELVAQYDAAVKQALVNANWLRTSDLNVLQAFVLFLVVSRFVIDIDTYWILTGVALRIAQRMQLQHDGEILGLPPYETEMRRRLFWQILPLDGYAGQFSGTGISGAYSTWTTKRALNVNDDQIYPGMAAFPAEQKGASDMIFCLLKTETTAAFRAVEGHTDELEVEKMINEVEATIESKYLRFCEITNPLHLYVLANARSALNIVRLRCRMRPLLARTSSDENDRRLFELGTKLVDTDNTTHTNPLLARFKWQAGAMFLWDAVMSILSAVAKPDLLSVDERDAAWEKITTLYESRPNYLRRDDPLRDALCKMTVHAWRMNPPSVVALPDFMRVLGYEEPITGDVDDSFADAIFGMLNDGQFNFDEVDFKF